MHYPQVALCKQMSHGRDLQPVKCLPNFQRGGRVLGDEKGLGISVSAKHSKGEFVNVKLEIPEQWGIHIRKP